MVDATAAIGPGDRTVIERSVRHVQRVAAGEAGTAGTADGGDEGETEVPGLVVVVNKIDRAPSGRVLERLNQAKAAVDALGDLPEVEYFPVSARSGKGVEALLAYVVARLPEGPPFFPADVVTDMPEALWVAELVREQLLAKTHDELPHSIACRVTEWEWPAHPMSRSSSSATPRRASSSARAARCSRRSASPPASRSPRAPTSSCLVKVEHRWQNREEMLDRLGY